MLRPTNYVLMFSLLGAALACSTKDNVSTVAAVNGGRSVAYYVDSVGGSDQNSGTSDGSAWRSLSKISSRTFAPGDSINLKNGSVWNSGGVTIKGSGTPDRLITLQSYGEGEKPIIRNPDSGMYGQGVQLFGSYLVVQGLKVIDIPAQAIYTKGGGHNIIRDNEIAHAGIGVQSDGPFNLITKNYIHELTMIKNTEGAKGTKLGDDDYGAVAIWISDDDNEISWNYAANCNAPSFDYGVDGGFVEIFGKGSRTYIHHNRAINTVGFVESSGPSIVDVKIHHNTLQNVVDGVLCLHDVHEKAPTIIKDVLFENNTVYKPTGDGYSLFGCYKTLTPDMMNVRNNIFYSNVQVARTNTFYQSNNIFHMIGDAKIGFPVDNDSSTADPLFADAAAGDLRLKEGSPAIDKGLSLGYTLDGKGLKTPIGIPDIGAYEYR